ncbi:alpha/beta hydrolase [Inconstantimicrobium mannanitabidum]|uniref:2-hydroxy-6-oxo-6-phenylhexa-2,4-dienoate hydrolase n=1 Tax=Inconstantimicrobium mannanitabidum TaxID=1604901 RepID=A0ACB5R8B7_9CLOT|nr:alpha/beta hydrolase [Clostridium sp. TW13]GKX65263.1 2-hydroxy-6-oxo-6-phenylhexa-2,4-dienoate hydrolase [Clostridium sp. TW13]
MKFYEFGEKRNPVLMLLPGTCCHWKNNYGKVIEMLTDVFYVVCVSYDGFDEIEQTEFIDMITEVQKIEEYIKRKFNGEVHTVYGCSLGGSFVGLLAQRKQIHMNHGILGSSDLDQKDSWKAKIQTKLFVPIVYKIIHKGKVNKIILNLMKKHRGEQYTMEFMHIMLGVGGEKLNFISKRSMENQFYSDLVTELEDSIDVEGTSIHCLYATKMGEIYLKRYKKHFRSPQIIKHDLLHEELLACRPNEWVKVIKRCAHIA